MCICWLIVEVILRNERSNEEIHIKNTLSHLTHQDSDVFRPHSVHPQEVLHQTEIKHRRIIKQTKILHIHLLGTLLYLQFLKTKSFNLIR